MSDKIDILPNCRLKEETNVLIWSNGTRWVRIFCANCGADGGRIMDNEWEAIKNFAFYLCDPCAAKWSPMVDTYMEPDAAFWAKIRAAQMEKFGRELTGPEIVEALKDENHILTKLAKERQSWRTKSEANQ